MKVSFILRTQISEHQWNTFIGASPQRVVYAYTWYLDVVAEEWGALVGEYEGRWQAVMPLPLKKKWGIGVVQQPLFCQFLGVFTHTQHLVAEAELLLLRSLPKYFRYVSVYQGRFQLPTSSFPMAFEVMPSTTFTIDLSVGYEQIFRNYTPDRQRNLRIARQADWQLVEGQDTDSMARLFRQNHAAQIKGGVGEEAYQKLQQLYEVFQKSNAVKLWYATQNGIIEAGAMFVIWDGRIIYLFNAASQGGRKANARTWLIDKVIQMYAGQNFVFDFESPSVETIADFYQSFGAKEEFFFSIRLNSLVWPLKQIQNFRVKKSPFFRRKKGNQ